MSSIAKIYVSAIVLIGAAVTVTQLTHWQSAGPVAVRLLSGVVGVRLALESVAAGHHRRAFGAVHFHPVRDRGAHAAGSAGVGLHGDLGAMLVELPAAPKWHQVLFNLGSMAITVATAGAVFHSARCSMGIWSRRCGCW